MSSSKLTKSSPMKKKHFFCSSMNKRRLLSNYRQSYQRLRMSIKSQRASMIISGPLWREKKRSLSKTNSRRSGISKGR